ncbi:MAG: phosphomannomutase [Deltaproteobacteria bacterium]|nr:MAG: phosphomannomutase [Deltaproteobacteria bacterium]
MERLTAFKAYDVRGRVPDELDEELAYKIGRSFMRFIGGKRVAIGRDVRPSGPTFVEALSRGMTDEGARVFDIGLCGTEELYFATFNNDLDGGVMVTASHNPADYNGMKFVRELAKPISADTGLLEIGKSAVDYMPPAKGGGSVEPLESREAYIEHLLGYIDVDSLKPLKVVVNAGNGCAGPVVDLLAKHLPFEFVKIFHEPDGTFPNGVPNPLLKENREATRAKLLEEKADLAIAWDGDFDRCFFFDEKGGFIEGYYLVGLFAEALLSKTPGAPIIHDPRLIWNTLDIVEKSGGEAVVSKSGHAFIKAKMRDVNALYGGEMSAHHYFRDFSYCDSGMIPWLLVTELICREERSLSSFVEERQRLFPVSGEINLTVKDQRSAISTIRDKYEIDALGVDELDGISIAFDRWRFNLRSSNTEPVIRLNVEARGDKALLDEKTSELLDTLAPFKV